MELRRLIHDYLESDPEVWDLQRSRVPPGRLRHEFHAIRRHLLADGDMGRPVAICVARDYRYLLAVLACMETGITFVPLRAEWPLARVEQIRGIVGFDVLLTDDLLERIVASPVPGPVVPSPPASPAQPLYCMFTSGTTGVPKGVVIPRAAYANFLRWCAGFFGDVGRADRLLNSTDYTFDVALAEVALALTRRCAFVCSAFRDDLFVLLNELHDLRVSVIATVPNNLATILDERWLDRADLSALRHALVAGARFPVALARQFRRLLPAVTMHNCYGPTEATIYCIARTLGDSEPAYVERDTVSVGRPLPGCSALVVDDRLRPLPAGERGELVIGGAQLMTGYLNDAEATRRAIVAIDGAPHYRTGDLAFVGAGGDFFVAGRNDDTVKVSGQRVNLSDIDGYVERLDFVRSCATIAIDDEQRGATLVLYVVASRPIAVEGAFSALAQVLPRHQLPRDVRFLEALPVNSSGKVAKAELERLYREGRSGDDDRVQAPGRD